MSTPRVEAAIFALLSRIYMLTRVEGSFLAAASCSIHSTGLFVWGVLIAGEVSISK